MRAESAAPEPDVALGSRKRTGGDAKRTRALFGGFLDLIQHGFRRHISLDLLYFVINVGLNAHMLRNFGNERCYLGELVFRKKTDLEIEIRSFVSGRSHAILRYENESR